ncbi:MAG: hypothetical protein AB8G11_11220 [Saprospiraceae bacterium]
MFNDDLRNAKNEKDIFGEIKMYRESGEHKDYVFILVEAKSDEKFYQKAITEKAIYFYGNGWGNVEKAIHQVNKFKTKGVLGIIDADFKRIEKVTIPENLFLTDFHDKEMMLLHSPAWKSVLTYFADTSIDVGSGQSKLQSVENQHKKPTLEILLELAKPIADIRLLNERNSYQLKFRKLKKKKFDYINYDFIDKQTLKIDKQKLQKAVENKSSKPNFFNNPSIQNQLKTIEIEKHDLRELCNGHDVINIFCLTLEKAIGNHSSSGKIQANRIEENLTITYRFEDFQQTNLYQDLLNWEKLNVPYQLF